MEPLIEIETIPIEIRMEINQARLEYARGIAQLEISRGEGGLSIRSQPIRVNIDTFECRNSIVPTTANAIRQQAQAGIQKAYQATAVMAREGRLMMEAQIDEDVIPQLARQQTQTLPTKIGMNFLPTVGPEINWEGGELSVHYEMDKLNFNWRMEQMSFTFVPGDIEFTITQQPDVVITYKGKPVYVPPSSAPDAPRVNRSV